jgi:hypothetical protein
MTIVLVFIILTVVSAFVFCIFGAVIASILPKKIQFLGIFIVSTIMFIILKLEIAELESPLLASYRAAEFLAYIMSWRVSHRYRQ